MSNDFYNGQDFEEVDTKIDLELATSKLPENERKIIELMLDGYSQIEISKRLLLSQQAISKRYTNAVIHLRQLMEL